MEAYEENHLVVLRARLDSEDCIGITNRRAVRAFIERVWSLRKDTAETLGVNNGAVLVDWADMMQESNMDILLV